MKVDFPSLLFVVSAVTLFTVCLQIRDSESVWVDLCMFFSCFKSVNKLSNFSLNRRHHLNFSSFLVVLLWEWKCLAQPHASIRPHTQIFSPANRCLVKWVPRVAFTKTISNNWIKRKKSIYLLRYSTIFNADYSNQENTFLLRNLCKTLCNDFSWLQNQIIWFKPINKQNVCPIFIWQYTCDCCWFWLKTSLTTRVGKYQQVLNKYCELL